MAGDLWERAERLREYAPDGEVLSRFLMDWSLVTIIQGPWGSGKSVACCQKVWMGASLQAPGPGGVRRTRWFVVRNTYPELDQSTVKTWLEWFPEGDPSEGGWGQFRRQRPYTHFLRNGDVEAEVIFLALDNEDDRKKLLSTEVTGAWVNEGREVPKAIIDDLLGRTGRFPKMIDGGPTWHGLIMDTNAPDEEHWIPVMRGDVPPPDWMTDEQIKALEKPKNWSFYIQPAGLVEVFDEHGNLTGYEPNVRAENVRYLPKGYYDNLTAGKPKTWIDVNILNRLGTHKDGRPVWPQYSQGVHLASKPLKAYPGVDVYVGIDFGRQPAAVAAQCLRGQWLIQHELTAQNEGSSIFAPQVKKWLVQCYGPDAVFHIFGDPSGDFMGPNDDRTPYQIFRANGLHVRPAPGGNRLPLRLETVESLLVRLVDGKPALMVSPSCTTLKAALAGGYAYRRLRMSGGAKYSDEPDKNRFSHIADALQYLVLGAGEGRTVVGAGKSVKPVQTAKAFDVGRARLDPLGKRNGRRPVVRSGI